MKTIVVGLIVLGCGFSVAARHVAGPDWLDSQNVTVVRYYAGAKWADFEKQVEGHLTFLKKQMEAGNVLYAGPFENESGGISIYRVTDLSEVERIVRQDPAVTQGAMTYSLHTWRMCKLREAPPSAASQPASQPAAKAKT